MHTVAACLILGSPFQSQGEAARGENHEQPPIGRGALQDFPSLPALNRHLFAGPLAPGLVAAGVLPGRTQGKGRETAGPQRAGHLGTFSPARSPGLGLRPCGICLTQFGCHTREFGNARTQGNERHKRGNTRGVGGGRLPTWADEKPAQHWKRNLCRDEPRDGTPVNGPAMPAADSFPSPDGGRSSGSPRAGATSSSAAARPSAGASRAPPCRRCSAAGAPARQSRGGA